MAKKIGDAKKVKALLEQYAKKQRIKWATTVKDKWGKQYYNKNIDASKVLLREVLRDEVIIEFDGKQYIEKNGLDKFRQATEELINKTLENLKDKAYSFKVYDHGGKCPHIHLFMDGLAKYEGGELKNLKERFIESVTPEIPELIAYDASLCGPHLIAMEHQPHYKYGTVKELFLEEDFGKNKLPKELIEEAKPASNKKIDTQAKYKVIFEELGKVPCYYNALTKKDVDWKPRNFLVSFLKHNFSLKEQDINEFIEQYHGWSDYDKEITATKIKPYFTKGHKSEKLKGFPKREIIEKNKFCISCTKCYFLREDAVKEEKKYKPIALDKVKEIFHKHLFFEDEDPIDIVLATAIGEKVEGDPLWLFLIAAPGGCKTEMLRSLADGYNFYHLDNLTSKTFVSGMMIGQGEHRIKVEDLLPQLNKKLFIFKDFTTVLEKNSDERREIIGQLRSIYDGFYSHKFGTTDKKISYRSRFGLLAGVTPVIDNHWKLMQQLGERFLKYRWHEDQDKTTRKSLDNEGKEKGIREELTAAIMGFLQNLEIKEVNGYDDPLFEEVLIELAKFVAIARTPISIKDSRSDFYFDYIPMPERPTRLVKQLKKMAKCLAIIHGKKSIGAEEIRQIVKIGLHTIPPDRHKLIETVANAPGECSRKYLRDEIKLPESSIYKILEQLSMLELITSKKIVEDSGPYEKCYYTYVLNERAKNIALYPGSFPNGFSKRGGVSSPKNDEIKLTNDDLIEFVREKGGLGYPAVEFCEKYGENRLDSLLSAGDVIEQPRGMIKILE